MHEIRVDSWDELVDTLYANSWEPGIERFRSDDVFRGVSNASFSTLNTTLMRLGGPYQQLEGHLLRNFRKYAHLEMIDRIPVDSTWHWLAVAQHHGLPTRLLDWTYSPFVAMHFATSALEHFNVDGLIWCVDYVAAQRLLPPPLRAVLSDEGANVFTAEMLQRAAKSLADFDALTDDNGPFVAFFEPPSLDNRIVNQFALFSMLSSPQLSLDRWLLDHPELLRRVIIPAELKWEIRDKLDQANITERVLFPGLDGLSAWLRRHYGPRRHLTRQHAEGLDGVQSTALPVPTEQ
ncbi:MAG: FRG domain-containing protein [Thermomicrobiales bacterium]|nr:FRG domain-containing protein [Thermomicrobiales bacterium]